MSDSERSDRSDGGGEFAIGRECADALAADRHHRERHPGGPSPLDDVAYELGNHDLARFRTSPVDAAVQSVVRSFRDAEPAARQALRASLRMGDLYTLVSFASRAAVRALRDEARDVALDGALAVAAVDVRRVDWRDPLRALGLLSYSVRRLGGVPGELFAAPKKLAQPEVVRMFERFDDPESDDADLSSWGYLEIETAEGPGFVECSFEPYSPQTDLVGLALRLADAIDADRYGVRSITAAVGLPDVWLPGATARDAQPVLGRLRGCVSLNARLAEDAHGRADAQQFTVFLAEAHSDRDAERLQTWAAVAGSHAVLPLSRGRIVCIAVAAVAGRAVLAAAARVSQ